MSDKKVNKVSYAGEVLMDLTEDTVTPETLKAGVTAHDASGAQITGTNQDVDPSTLGNTYRKYLYGESFDSEFLSRNTIVKIATVAVKDLNRFIATSAFEGGAVPAKYTAIHLQFYTFQYGIIELIGGIYFVGPVEDQSMYMGGFNVNPISGPDISDNIGHFYYTDDETTGDITIYMVNDSEYKHELIGWKLINATYDFDAVEVTSYFESVEELPESVREAQNVWDSFRGPVFTGPPNNSSNGKTGGVPAPNRTHVNNDFTLLPTGDWGRLKAMGYYQATANSTIDSPANKIMSYIISSTVAESLSDKLPSANNQVLLSMPAGDSNDYFQLSVDTAANDIFMRTRKKVDNVDTWTTWEKLLKGNLLTGITESMLSADITWSVSSTLPYDFFYGVAIVYNNEIHILGSGLVSYRKYHYKWNGSEWVSVSTIPYEFTHGTAVVYNNEIHILGGSFSLNSHYKWNGSEWVSVSTLPYDLAYSTAVVYNNEIHILGGSFSLNSHYKWNGSEWVSVSTLPYGLNNAWTVVYNNEIHILGSSSEPNSTLHYKWNGSEWVSVSTLPYKFRDGWAVVYNNEIHILGGFGDTASKYHYKWNGSEWVSVSTLPYDLDDGTAVIYNNEIHILGGYPDAVRSKHYSLHIPTEITLSDSSIKSTSFIDVSTAPYGIEPTSVIVNDGSVTLNFDESVTVTAMIVN